MGVKGIVGERGVDERLHAVLFAIVLAACPASIGHAGAAIAVGALFLVPFDAPWMRIAVAGSIAADAAWDPGAPAHLAVAGPRWAALGLVALAGIGAVDPHRRLRIGAAGVALAIGALTAAKQVAIDGLLPGAGALAVPLFAMGWVGAAAVCAAPFGRAAGAALMGGGAFQLVAYGMIASRVADGSVLDGLRAMAWREDARILERIEERAVAEARAGHPYDAMTVVEAWPTRPAAGEAVVRALGPAVAARLGWDPWGGIDGKIASDLAFALDARGEGGRAVTLLRRQPMVGPAAFAAAVLARDAGDEAFADRAFAGMGPVEGVAVDPVPVIAVGRWSNGGEVAVSFVSKAPIAALRIAARGEAWRGDPELAIAIGGRRWGPTPVPAQGAWTWDVGLPAGAYRLVVRYPNDADGPGGDRNLDDVVITAVR